MTFSCIYIRIFIGSIIASFVPGDDASSIAAAVENMTNDPNAISDLTATSINIYGKTYSMSASKSSSSVSSATDYTAMIIIIVVGLVGSAIIVIGVYFGIRQYENRQQRHPLINEMAVNENVERQSKIKKDELKLTEHTPTSKSILPKNKNQVEPVMNNNTNTDRPPSASVSVTTLDFTSANTDDRVNATLPTVELIKLD